MGITINIRYAGTGGAARAFAQELRGSGILDAIRAEEGNEGYEYFVPLDGSDGETIMLIERWASQEALDAHHALPLMGQIAELHEKYDLHMSVQRFVDGEENAADEAFIRS